MTKAELEEYVEELHGVIEDAAQALEDSHPKEALEILDEYCEEEEPEGGEEEPGGEGQ